MVDGSVACKMMLNMEAAGKRKLVLSAQRIPNKTDRVSNKPLRWQCLVQSTCGRRKVQGRTASLH
jgi:hypothetical protein